jgi:hypothetical protein
MELEEYFFFLLLSLRGLVAQTCSRWSTGGPKRHALATSYPPAPLVTVEITLSGGGATQEKTGKVDHGLNGNSKISPILFDSLRVYVEHGVRRTV